MQNMREKTGSRRRGVTAPLVVVTVATLMGFAALSVDLGYIYSTHSDMQVSVDAAALAGASGLLEGNQATEARAVEFAGYNHVAGTTVADTNLDVIIGNWEWKSKTFYPLDGSEVIAPNAVRVIGRRQNLSLLFGNILGTPSVDVSKGATALAGSGRCIGIWGVDGINSNGNILTDSYDSSQGPYGGTNIRRNGDFCTCTDIVVDGDVDIYGDAMYGPGYSFVPSGNAYKVWGLVGEHSCNAVAPTFDSTQASMVNDNAGLITDKGHDPFNGTFWDLTVSGQDNLTLPGGTYYFTSVLIEGQATITIAGPTVMYITGPALFTGGGLVFPSNDAGDLVIYSEGPTVVIDGSAAFYGAVIAPDATIISEGSGVFYGTLIGRSLDFHGSTEIHVDEALVAELFGVDVINPVLVE